jgi:TetR/AcrR family transcriptional regulator, repressor for neighboring sulfatase
MTTTRATRGARPADAPTGRQEVVAAILDSAAEMFAERGPATASIRDIAGRAGVNHGLVFRHFGTKEQLVGSVLDHLASSTTALIDAQAPMPDIEAAADQHLRVIARALMDGFPVGELQSSFPAVARLLDEIRPRYGSDAEARMAAANVGALQLGWQLFEPFLRSATGLQGTPRARLQESIQAARDRILEPAN